MKRLFVVALALMAGACSTLTANLLQRSAKPKPAAVQDYVCAGDETGVTDYLSQFRIERYQQLEALQAAKREVAKRPPAECPAALK